MRVLYFDCFCGISGDMTLGALIDCGVDVEEFKSELGKLNMDGYAIEVTRSLRNGISGTHVNVVLHQHTQDHDHHHEHHNHDEEYHDGHHDVHMHHTHHESHNEGHGGVEHHHRNLIDIEHIIDESGLNQRVKSVSKLIFRNLAVAEAKIHGKSVEDVHFHEVGAVDSIVDIVGTAICIDMLKIDRFVSSPVNTGMGFVECQHGIIPVPGPAALELLKGVPVYSMDIDTELVTPTGAAIISTLCESFGPIPAMTVQNTGYGVGSKQLEIPNLLRVIMGEDKKKNHDVYMIECNIDDMNGEFYDHTMKRLFDEGALDVFMTNILMKKNRPAVKLSVIAKVEDVDKLSGVIFSETSTIGIRKYAVERETLNREVIEVDTRFGAVKVKAAYRQGKAVNYAPEYEDVRRIAEQTGAALKEIYAEAIKNI